jgi:hypothetical protein
VGWLLQNGKVISPSASYPRREGWLADPSGGERTIPESSSGHWDEDRTVPDNRPKNGMAHVTPALKRRIRSQRHSTGSHWLDRAEAKSLSMIFIVVMAVSIGQVGTGSPSR